MVEREDGPIPDDYKMWKATDSDDVQWCVIEAFVHYCRVTNVERSYRHAVTNARCIIACIHLPKSLLT